MSAIYKKELKSAFCGMTGVIFAAYVLVWFGIFTVVVNIYQGYPQFEYTIANVAFISLLAIPVITMRSFSEEKHSKTDQLLYSLPIKTVTVVFAKYLAMLTIFALPALIAMIYPFAFSAFGTVYINTAFSTMLAYYLLGASLIAICMFISSLTESQVIAAILSLGAIILIYYLSAISSLFSTAAATSLAIILILCVALGAITYKMTENPIVAGILTASLAAACIIIYAVNSSLFEGLIPDVLSSLDLFSKTNKFINGVLDVKAVVFFLSTIAFFNFLTVQSVEKKRWN